MGTWFIGAGRLEDVYKVESVLRIPPVECDDAGRDAILAFLKERKTWSDDLDVVHPHEEIFLDGGGCVSTKEPKVGWEANGTSFKTFVRQLPFAIEAMRSSKSSRRMPTVLYLGGFRRIYLFSDETRRQSIPEMERLLKGTESLRQELEGAFQETFSGSGGKVISVRNCGCLSGKTYVECCGKHVS